MVRALCFCPPLLSPPSFLLFPPLTVHPLRRRFSGDEAFTGDQRDASRLDAGVELGVVVEGKRKGTRL